MSRTTPKDNRPPVAIGHVSVRVNKVAGERRTGLLRKDDRVAGRAAETVIPFLEPVQPGKGQPTRAESLFPFLPVRRDPFGVLFRERGRRGLTLACGQRREDDAG